MKKTKNKLLLVLGFIKNKSKFFTFYEKTIKIDC